MWRLSGELAVNCSTLVDLPRQTHGLRWTRDELMAPPNRRLTLNGADDVQHWRQTLSGRTSILALFHSSSRAPAHTTYTGCVVVPAASVSPSEAEKLCHMVVFAGICCEVQIRTGLGVLFRLVYKTYHMCILFFERYVRTLTYSILAYAYPQAMCLQICIWIALAPAVFILPRPPQ